MITHQDKILSKFDKLSLQYHNLSFLFRELGTSLKLEMRKENINLNSRKQVKEFMQSKGIDFEKLEKHLIEDVSILKFKKDKEQNEK